MTRTLAVSEREFMEQVRQLAELQGFLIYHTHDSRRSNPGFPDLFCVRNGKALAIELKVGHNRLTTAQEEWLVQLQAVPGIETFIFRPDDWSRLEEVLT